MNPNLQLVAGIDTSTQSVKVVIRDAKSGQLIREGRAAHPDGSEVDPAKWWSATEDAIKMAGGLDDVVAIAVAGQQHGMVALDKDGKVIKDEIIILSGNKALETRINEHRLRLVSVYKEDENKVIQIITKNQHPIIGV